MITRDDVLHELAGLIVALTRKAVALDAPIVENTGREIAAMSGTSSGRSAAC